jgi:hypothetical protein
MAHVALPKEDSITARTAKSRDTTERTVRHLEFGRSGNLLDNIQDLYLYCFHLLIVFATEGHLSSSHSHLICIYLV